MFNNDIYYEVWSRKHNVKNKRQELKLVAGFKKKNWQFAIKLINKLKEKNREVVLVEQKVTHVEKHITDKKV